MDNLEKFITGNKAQFSDHLPSPVIWENIEKGLKEDSAKKFSIVKFIRAGVAAIGLLLLGIWFGVDFLVDDMDRAISNSSFKDYKQTEQYYSLQVNNYLEQVEKVDLDGSIVDELQQLDEVYQELRDELLHAEIINQDMIISAMIKNYQVKIGMLERILDKTKTKNLNKEIKNHSNEKISI